MGTGINIGSLPKYKVLTITELSYSDDTIFDHAVLENTLGQYALNLIAPNTLRISLKNYETGIDGKLLYIEAEENKTPKETTDFGPSLIDSDLSKGEIIFFSVGNDTKNAVSRANLEIRIYNKSK